MPYAMLPLPAVAVPRVSRLRHSGAMLMFFLLYLILTEAFMYAISILVGLFTVLPGGYQLRAFKSAGSFLPILIGIVLAGVAIMVHSNSARQRKWRRSARAQYSFFAAEVATWQWQIIGYATDEAELIIDIHHGPRIVRLYVEAENVKVIDDDKPLLSFSHIGYRLPPANDLERGPGVLVLGGEVLIRTTDQDALPPLCDEYSLTVSATDVLS